MGNKVRKAEHAGPKNGGGHWGKRADAKKQSNRVRREQAKKDVAASPEPDGRAESAVWGEGSAGAGDQVDLHQPRILKQVQPAPAERPPAIEREAFDQVQRLD
jgi:hypothetical protein